MEKNEEKMNLHYGKPVKREIGNHELKLRPLEWDMIPTLLSTIKDLNIEREKLEENPNAIMEKMDENVVERIQKLVLETLKNAEGLPDECDDEESLKRFGAAHFSELMAVVFEINDLGASQTNIEAKKRAKHLGKLKKNVKNRKNKE